MSDLTATVIGASGRMGQEHVAAYESCGIEVVRCPPNIVSIATPDDCHASNILVALNDDRIDHVFCEKPICQTECELERIKFYLLGGGHFAQNFPLRYQPIFADLDISGLGEIYRIDASYNWGRTEKLFEGWRAKDPNYSLVMGGLIHMVDLVLWKTGLDMEVVSAIGCSFSGFRNHDTVSAICRLSNGGVCNLTVDGGPCRQEHNHHLEIRGTKEGVGCNNYEETDKQACIKEFVKNIRDGNPPERDFRATEICLEIDRLASISDAP